MLIVEGLDSIKEFKPDLKLLLDIGPPPSLFKVNPRNIKGKDWWDIERKKAYTASQWRCGACGCQPETPLEAHEIYRIDFKTQRVYLKKIVALCDTCHWFVHRNVHFNRRQDKAKMLRIYNQITKTLKDAKLQLPKTNFYNYPHDKWRLVLDKKLYAPVFDENISYL